MLVGESSIFPESWPFEITILQYLQYAYKILTLSGLSGLLAFIKTENNSKVKLLL